MRRVASLGVFPLLGAALVAGLGCARPIKTGDPLPGLTKQQRELFEQGRKVMEKQFTPETGLGPLSTLPDAPSATRTP